MDSLQKDRTPPPLFHNVDQMMKNCNSSNWVPFYRVPFYIIQKLVHGRVKQLNTVTKYVVSCYKDQRPIDSYVKKNIYIYFKKTNILTRLDNKLG